MSFDHAALVGFAKSYGLFYFIALLICVLIYVYWPSNRRRFEEAAKTILDDEDRPWR
jgi:cytochrome c oxidase cbb3-type subunit 4